MQIAAVTSVVTENAVRHCRQRREFRFFGDPVHVGGTQQRGRHASRRWSRLCR